MTDMQERIAMMAAMIASGNIQTTRNARIDVYDTAEEAVDIAKAIYRRALDIKPEDYK